MRLRVRVVVVLMAGLMMITFLGAWPSQAQIAVPAPPQITVLPSSPTEEGGISPIVVRLSLQPHDASYQPRVIHYSFRVSLRPDVLSDPNPVFGRTETGELRLFLDQLDPNVDLYMVASVAVSGYSPDYITPWSGAVVVFGPHAGQGGGPVPPSGDTLALTEARITASPGDAWLRRTISFVRSSTVLPIVRYEYGWATKADSQTPGVIQRCKVELAKCTLDYRAPDPSMVWNVLARAVGADGAKGPWLVQKVQVPKAPRLFVFGDSVSSGHHRDYEGAQTICTDESYSYGQAVWNQLQAGIPAKWRLPHGYANEAKSGFSTAKVIKGGTDACGDSYDSPLERLTRALSDNAGSWNLVVGSAGINDTNWGEVLIGILDGAVHGRVTTAKQCKAYADQWNFNAVRSQLSQNAHLIAFKLREADAAARIAWLSYYNAANTGTGLLRIPRVCKNSFATALEKAHGTLQGALASSSVLWVNIGHTLNSKDNLLQDIYPSDIQLKNPGWPHPNRIGHEQMATTILRAR